MRIRNRTLTLTERTIIQTLRKANPRRVEDFADLGIMMSLVDSGSYRVGYSISNTELFVKIPKEDEYCNINHSLKEVKAWKAILRTKDAKFLPPLRYHNEHGIVVTDKIQIQFRMEHADRLKYDPKFEETFSFSMKLGDKFQVSDLHNENVGLYNNRLVVADLGCFYE